DEQALLELYQDILGNDYEVITFSTPDQFIQFIESQATTNFDLLLTDLKMPRMSGIDMVKQAQKKGHFFPVILFSGYLDKSSALDAMEIGVCRLLEKPTSPNHIINSIDELLIENDVRNLRKE